MSAQVANGDATTKDKKKFRLSNPFSHKDQTKDSNKEPDSGASTLNPNNRDSAYGGSETTSDPSPAASSQQIPTISQNQADQQGAPVETKIDSRGRVITTTTTTVTTTTTTTEGHPVQIPAGKEVIVTKEEHNSDSNGNAEQGAPSIPAKNDLRNRSPNGGHLAPHNAVPPQAPSNQYQGESSSPTSPSHQNFSYPGRSYPQTGGRPPNDQQYQAYRAPQQNSRPRPPTDPSYGQPPLNEYSPRSQYGSYPDPHGQFSDRDSVASGGDSQYVPRQSTAQSIRTAAAGIHGAGEALRGALNSSVARHTGASEEEIARHNAVVERGRMEIETGRFQKRPPVPNIPSPLPEETEKEKKPGVLKGVLRKKSRERGA